MKKYFIIIYSLFVIKAIGNAQTANSPVIRPYILATNSATTTHAFTVDALKPIAIVYPVDNENTPIGCWILSQTSKQLKLRSFRGDSDWEFTITADGNLDYKIGNNRFFVRKIAIVNPAKVTTPSAELLPKNGYVSVLAQGCIPTPSKIITGYTDSKNKGGAFSVQLPFGDGSKIIELSWNAMIGKWGCTRSGSTYIPVEKPIIAIYLYDESNSEIFYTQSN